MRHLIQTTIRKLAAQYGFKATDKLVIENAEQADKFHGTVHYRDGKPLVSWSTDCYGVTDAEKLLDGLLCQERSTINMDCLAAEDFERNAY